MDVTNTDKPCTFKEVHIMKIYSSHKFQIVSGTVAMAMLLLFALNQRASEYELWKLAIPLSVLLQAPQGVFGIVVPMPPVKIYPAFPSSITPKARRRFPVKEWLPIFPHIQTLVAISAMIVLAFMQRDNPWVIIFCSGAIVLIVGFEKNCLQFGFGLKSKDLETNATLAVSGKENDMSDHKK